MSVRSKTIAAGVLAACAGAFAVTDVKAEIGSYYIGVDGLQTIASGTYSGLPNPNFNHLTFLFAHPSETSPSGNHYHSKAIEVYTGPNLGANTAVTRSASNFVPEGTLPPLNLSPGSGIYAGKLVSNPYTDDTDPNYHFSFLTFTDTQTLNGFAAGTGETFMFNSSNGRWTPNPRPAHLHVEIVSLTPGLNVGDAGTLSLGGAGTELHLSDPGESFEFTPVLWTDASAAPGTYEAVFRFFDEDNTFGDAGDVRLRVAVVPEPASLGVVAIAAVGLLARRRRA
jgi:hypothetical protein